MAEMDCTSDDMSSSIKTKGEDKKSNEAVALQEFSPELLRIYYSRLFPYSQMFRWLSYGNEPDGNQHFNVPDYFFRREFTFTMEDDIYVRYLCFRDAGEMEAKIREKQPHKIDIGPVYTVAPKEHATVKPSSFRPVERELVFDIDMNDYDEIRTCCKGAQTCQKCWVFLAMASKVLNKALREDFGFKHLLFVYSGRRGVHCWVADETARQLNNEARSAIVEYLSVVQGNKNSDTRTTSTWPVHASLERAYQLLHPLFEEHIIGEEGQNIFGEEDSWKKVLSSVPSPEIREKYTKEWENSSHTTTDLEKWECLIEEVEGFLSSKKNKRLKVDKEIEHAFKLWKYETVFSYCYPRLDENVSKTMNHLLKSPFCIHPKTGRVCVPFDPETCEDFDPTTVPTLGSLCSQLDHYQGSPDIKDIDKTDMKSYIEFFEKDFLAPLYKSIKLKIRRQNESLSASSNDW